MPNYIENEGKIDEILFYKQLKSKDLDTFLSERKKNVNHISKFNAKAEVIGIIIFVVVSIVIIYIFYNWNKINCKIEKSKDGIEIAKCEWKNGEMKENLKMVNLMGMEYINGRMVIYMKDNLKIIKNMGKEHINGRTVIYTKENLKIIKSME